LNWSSNFKGFDPTTNIVVEEKNTVCGEALIKGDVAPFNQLSYFTIK
jgi:hypothetical protein